MSNAPFRPVPGQDIRVLPKIRLEGFEGDPEQGQKLVDAFGGSLRQFYNAQASNRDASALGQWSASIDRGDHQIRYLNQFGQETLTLTVHPKKIEELIPKKPETLPDYCVVDFTLPGSATFARQKLSEPDSAWGEVPTENYGLTTFAIALFWTQKTDEDGYPLIVWGGSAPYTTFPSDEPPLLEAAGITGPPPPELNTTPPSWVLSLRDGVVSFKIDFTADDGREDFEFEVYGMVAARYGFKPNGQQGVLHWATSGRTISLAQTYPQPGTTAPTWVQAGADWSIVPAAPGDYFHLDRNFFSASASWDPVVGGLAPYVSNFPGRAQPTMVGGITSSGSVSGEVSLHFDPVFVGPHPLEYTYEYRRYNLTGTGNIYSLIGFRIESLIPPTQVDISYAFYEKGTQFETRLPILWTVKNRGNVEPGRGLLKESGDLAIYYGYNNLNTMPTDYGPDEIAAAGFYSGSDTIFMLDPGQHMGRLTVSRKARTVAFEPA